MIENIILESFGFALIATSSYLLTKYIHFSPLLIDRRFSATINQAYFIAIPLVAYLLFRIIFGIAIFISSRIKLYIPRYRGKSLR